MPNNVLHDLKMFFFFFLPKFKIVLSVNLSVVFWKNAPFFFWWQDWYPIRYLGLILFCYPTRSREKLFWYPNSRKKVLVPNPVSESGKNFLVSKMGRYPIVSMDSNIRSSLHFLNKLANFASYESSKNHIPGNFTLISSPIFEFLLRLGY